MTLTERIVKQKDLAMEFALAFDKVGDVPSRIAWTNIANLLCEILNEELAYASERRKDCLIVLE